MTNDIGKLRDKIAQLQIENKELAGLAKKSETAVKRAQAEKDKAVAALDKKSTGMEDNHVALTWLNNYEADENYLAYSQLGWLMYSKENGVWQAPDIGKIRKRLKSTFLGAGKTNVKTRDINSAIGLAADHVSRQAANDWNNYPNIIICKSNIFNLDTLTTSPHNHEIYATSKLSADYNPDCLQSEVGLEWLKMVNLFFGDKADFIQEFIGYSLTTSTAYDLSIWLISLGGGGKSTFLRAIASMMGDRCGALNLSLLNKKGEESLGVVSGKTLLLAEEVGNKVKIERGDLLKLIIDGGNLSVKQMRMDPVTIKSNCKVLWGMNQVPTVLDQDGSISRRVKIVNMKIIPLSEQVPEVRQRAESGYYNDAVLMWAIEGLKRVRERGGFDIPKEISKTSLDQIGSFDIEKRFLKENCVHIPGFWIPTENGRGLGLSEQAKDLHAAYLAYCDSMSYKYPKGMGNLRQEWIRLLGSNRHIEKRNRIYYLDIKIINKGGDDNDFYYDNEIDFIKGNLELSEGGEVSVQYLHDLYNSYCKSKSVTPQPDNLTLLLNWMDIKVIKSSEKLAFIGISLL